MKSRRIREVGHGILSRYIDNTTINIDNVYDYKYREYRDLPLFFYIINPNGPPFVKYKI